MALFIDVHEGLHLPAEAIAELAKGETDEFGVRQVELYYNDAGVAYCLLDGPDADAIRNHHEALGVQCGPVQQVGSLH
ncbi:nickel-binding protein [Antrihabitans cavernicola]|uniref:DUF4242 domain-containing protein n=1 Tax=Antrihabitans cavernicola TaxID=2495913 RepID=A0A5A7SJQ4_9NOCA|nr:nickel-binding protein [Spelaeibacter cavernicola]KAA0024421.1 DUF4242 domain-containing protein [Spelaeibacter cavernicola]